MSELPGSAAIAVLGCGLMGSSVARAFASSQPVVVWNRTVEKAQALAEHPAIKVADSSADAGDLATVLVSVLEGYDTVREVLKDVDLQGKAVVNLTTGSSEDAFEMHRWVEGRGGTYLEGIVLCYPQEIGTPEGLVVYSGSEETFAEHAHQLVKLGDESRYVSSDIGGANDCAVASTFLIAALTAFAESAPYILSSGVRPADFQAVSQALCRSLSRQVTEISAAIETDNFHSNQATIDAYESAARTFRLAMQKSGNDSVVLAATERVLAETQEAGFGKLAMASVSRLQ